MNSWFLQILNVIGGLISLVIGGELLVRGASRLAVTMKISPLIIGLTVVAFGTSSPELAVSVQSALAGKGDIALGNVVGSNVFNILFVLGISALVVPLVVSSRLIRWDVPLMLAASVLLLLLGLDGRIGRLDGLGMFGCLLMYIFWCVRQSRSESGEVQSEFAREMPASAVSATSRLIQVGLIVGGLILLSLGSNWLIRGCVFIASTVGVNDLIIGLTIVAAGTSLPEFVTSIMAAWRGEREIAVGNVVGSNIFNILGVLGLASALSPAGIEMSSAAIRLDIPVMIAVTIACLPVFFTGRMISRWEGGMFLACYIAYTAVLVCAATEATLARTLATVMVVIAISLTAICLLVGVIRFLRLRKETR